MITNSKEQTTGGYNDMDGSQEIRCSEKEDRHKRVLTIWFNFYEAQEQRWFNCSSYYISGWLWKGNLHSSLPQIDWRGTEGKFSEMRMLYIIIGVVVIVLKIHQAAHIKIYALYGIYLPYINYFNIQQKANEKVRCRHRQMSKAESNYSFQI